METPHRNCISIRLTVSLASAEKRYVEPIFAERPVITRNPFGLNDHLMNSKETEMMYTYLVQNQKQENRKPLFSQR